jgi:hypothetical protein
MEQTMYDITRTALTRAWRTGFGTIVRREDFPSVEHYPTQVRRARPRAGLRRLLPFVHWSDAQDL